MYILYTIINGFFKGFALQMDLNNSYSQILNVW